MSSYRITILDLDNEVSNYTMPREDWHSYIRFLNSPYGYRGINLKLTKDGRTD